MIKKQSLISLHFPYHFRSKIMHQSNSEIWRKEVGEYEARMFEYFTQCSVRLRDWYEKGGEESEAYRAEYQRLSDEYQRYMSYIQQIHEFFMKSKGTSSDITPATSEASQSSVSVVIKSAIESAPVSSSAQSTVNHNAYHPTTAAAFYIQYYQEMITYFEKLLVTIEQAQQNGNSSSNEDADEDIDGKAIDESQIDEEVSEPETDTTVVGGDMCCNPRAVMEQYFERYGEPGKWDWASWNNYLSWIARTNPQWYGIFLEYSQTLGIDWDEMYKCWRLSDAAGQGDSNLPGMAHSAHGVFPTDLSHIRLFPNVPNQSDDDDDGANEWFCRTCNMQLETQRAFTLHLRGVTHIQKALGEVQQQQAQQLAGWPNYRSTMQSYVHPPPMPPPPPPYYQQQQRYDEQLRHQAWLQSQYWQRNNAEFVVPGTLYCDLCKVNSSTYATLQAHLNGRRHRENVDIYYRTGEASMLKGKRGAHAKPTSRLQLLLDTCTQPLVGLGYVVERQFGDEEDCVYLCELCDERITRQTAIKHVCDVYHRVNYMKLHYPGMCAIVVNDLSSREIRLRRIEFFARKIEDFEGRKRVKVKQLSSKLCIFFSVKQGLSITAFDALRRIWRPLAHEEVEKPKRRPLMRRKRTPVTLRKSPVKKVKAVPRPSKEPDSKASAVSLKDNNVQTESENPKESNNSTKPEDSDGELEEGEITEDSSDENTSFGASSRTVQSTRGANRSPMVNGDLKEVANSGEADQTDSNQDSTNEDLDELSLLPESVLSFEPDSDCLAFIENLRSGGFLELGTGKRSKLLPEIGAKSNEGVANESQVDASEKPTEETPSIEEQFAREADWVLERTRAQRELEEEYRRQANTAPTAPVSVTSDSGAINLDEGYTAGQDDVEVWYENNYPEEVCADENGPPSPTSQLLLPPLGTSFGPGLSVIAMTNTAGISDQQTTSLPASPKTAPPPTSESISTGGSMDPGRQRLAVSIGAVEIIVSALNALRDAGQLPEYLNTVFDKTGEQPDKIAMSDVTRSASPVILASEKSDLANERSTMSERDDKVPRLEADELPQSSVPAVTAAPSVSVSAPRPSPDMLRPFNSASARAPHPNDSDTQLPAVQPPFIPTPSVGPNSSLLGPPGPAGPPSVPSAVVPPRPLIPPPSRARSEVPPSNRPLRPQYIHGPPIPGPLDRPLGAPRHPMSNSMIRPPAPVRQPVPPSVNMRKDGIPDLPSKVASYIRPDPNRPSEVMFDAYALFSRRGDDPNRSGHGRQCQPPPAQLSERTRFGRPGARGANRKDKKSKSGGRKLSAIADFLGVNEPPPAAPKTSAPSDVQVPVQPTPVSTPAAAPACVSTIPYLISLPSLTQNTMSPISLYIPQMSSFRMPTLPSPTSPLTPGGTPSMVPAPGISPAMLPTITYKSNSSILGAPANLDEFIRKLRTI
ncbi:hypothetical protein D915_007707 [Fasciola hepatica]|uniref:C2H2-type domain-containing protein n=1 Tax=Fasciola hepatica TaxID=6192 RepID=A0A4E0R3A1_FASHE|nr:hypothetical protein D915_007707 [Fasciola hepatica]